MIEKRTHGIIFISSLRFLSILALFIGLFAVPAPAEASIHVVNQIDDTFDGFCDPHHCTLREAIHAANTSPGKDKIVFDFEIGGPTWTIWLYAGLPLLTDDGTTIDGTTMPEYDGGPSVTIAGSDDIDYAFHVESRYNTIRGLRFTGFRGPHIGAPIVLSGTDNRIEGNVLVNNRVGLIITHHSNEILNNWIGVTPSGEAAPNESDGVRITNDENLFQENVIAYNGGAGIVILPGIEWAGNTFTRNSIYDNGGLGIDIGDSNRGIQPPILTGVDLSTVAGMACRGCIVELFLSALDHSGYGEGKTFLAEGVADASRNFSIALDPPVLDCDPITATATDTHGNTSEFSLNERAGMCTRVEVLPESMLFEIYLTVNTVDDLDDGSCTEEHCSLREAIHVANSHPGRDTISFAIAGRPPHTIRLTSPLPPLTNDRTMIDGSSEPDYAGVPVVHVRNEGEVMVGLRVESNRNTIRGLGIHDFGEITPGEYGYYTSSGYGIDLEGGRNWIEDNFFTGNGMGIFTTWFSNDNVIQGNEIGTETAPNGNGIYIGGDYNIIGGTAPGEGNLISGNMRYGIWEGHTEGTQILGNIIGGDATGTFAIPNGYDGINTQGDDVRIGGLEPGEGNLIIGNGGSGVVLYDVADDDVVAGNTIRDNGEYGIVLTSCVGDRHTFTRNSIYDNGDLGIKTGRSGDYVPILEPASQTEVNGITCRGCVAEVFLADPDPTGFGEGKTFLGEARADIAGRFSVEISDVDYCDEITATSTDGDGNTTNFAENVLVTCIAPSRALVVTGMFIVFALFVAAAVFIRPSVPGESRWIIPAGAVMGGLVSAGLLVLGIALPFVQIDLTRGPLQERAPAPPPPICQEFLNPQGFTPEDGAVFGLEEDPALAWAPMGDLPEGEIRWRVEVQAPDQTLRSLTVEDASLQFSDFGFEPRPGGRFDWRVNGVTTIGEEGWQTFCTAEAMRSFRFVNPALEAAMALEEEPEVVEEPPPEVSLEPSECTPMATAQMNVTCREGPLKVYRELGYLMEGESSEVQGRNADSTWWWILLSEKQVNCWVWGGAVETECDVAALPVIAAPPTPTVPPPAEEPPPEDKTPPPAPSPIAPTGGQTLGCMASALLVWDAVSDESGIDSYAVELQRSSDNASWGGAPGSPWSTTATKQPVSVECGWYYRWRVRARDGAGNWGAFSSWATFAVSLQ